ncbi:MAG: phosphoglycerate kinase [Kiritimatiellia bacterium]|jgi:phosphoglycerate kinase
MNKKTIEDIDVSGKRVLMRVDFNVPVKAGVVGDDTRITAALPTINKLLASGASVVLMSHLGRPKGEVSPEYSLAPIAPVLAEKLGREVKFVEECVGEKASAAAAALQPGEVLLLENLRFHAEEEGKGVDQAAQDAFAAALASLGDVYVNDAFGTAHRAHASMAGVTKHFENNVAGDLLEKEINYLVGALENPERPFVAIMGGAKVKDKIQVIKALLGKVDRLIIGGGMAYVFYKVQGGQIGKSLCNEDDIPLAKELLELAGDKIVLPLDNIIADDFSGDANTQIAKAGEIPDGWEGLDIGPESAKLFADIISTAKTVVWNGPMGCFDLHEKFAGGTNAVGQALADTDCVSIIGGGDSVAALNQAGLGDQITHMSTGGGASLELLEGKVLPGLAALTDK